MLFSVSSLCPGKAPCPLSPQRAPLGHFTQLRKKGEERNIATKPYLRGITLQSARLPAPESHLFCVLMCVKASGQGDGLQGPVAKESYLRRYDGKGEGGKPFSLCFCENQ